jgi:hypothetical protein
MSQHPEESSSLHDPLRATLENLVMPVFEEFAAWDQNGPTTSTIYEDEGQLSLCAFLDGPHLITVTPIAIDRVRTILRFELEVGVFLNQLGDRALILGALLDGSLFHVHFGLRSTIQGKLRVACDFTVRADDQPLVYQRTVQLIGIGNVLDWFLALHMPERLNLRDLVILQSAWGDSLNEDWGAILDRGLEAPPFERPAENLLRIAQGLGRWEDVLRLLAEHPDECLTKDRVRLKVFAHRGLDQWIPAIEAAEAGGLKQGCYEDEDWLDPSYILALVESGREMEALRLLGSPTEEDFGYYDWLRGLAMRRAGYSDGAEEAFERYQKAYPGDIYALGRNEL